MTRLSPPTIAVSRRGTRSFERIDCTATVSVGETMAPRTKHAGQGTSGINACATTPTTRIVAATRPIASIRIGRSQRRKSIHDVSNASE